MLDIKAWQNSTNSPPTRKATSQKIFNWAQNEQSND